MYLHFFTDSMEGMERVIMSLYNPVDRRAVLFEAYEVDEPIKDPPNTDNLPPGKWYDIIQAKKRQVKGEHIESYNMISTKWENIGMLQDYYNNNGGSLYGDFKTSGRFVYWPDIATRVKGSPSHINGRQLLSRACNLQKRRNRKSRMLISL
jgi:hypothetical protein